MNVTEERDSGKAVEQSAGRSKWSISKHVRKHVQLMYLFVTGTWLDLLSLNL